MRASAYLLFVVLIGCGAATPERTATRPAPRSPDGRDEHTGISLRRMGGDVSLLALPYAQALSVRPLASADVVVIGCTEGPTELRPQTEEARVLGFVARVDPHTGRVVWARHLDLPAGSFENACLASYQPAYPGPRLVAPPLLAVGRHVFVAAFSMDPRPRAPVDPTIPFGSVLLALDVEDGSTHWSRPIGTVSELAAVTQLAVAGDGVDAVVRRFAADGLDTHSLMRFDADGGATELAVLQAAPMGGRRCYLGAGGCAVEASWLGHREDGSVTMVGSFCGTQLTLGTHVAGSEPADCDTFFAELDASGAPRGLRASPFVLTTILQGADHEVIATVHARDHEERVQRIDVRTGAISEWAPGDGSLAALLRLDAARRARFTGARLTHANGVRDLGAGADEGPELLRRLASLDPDGSAPELAALPGGGFVALLPAVRGTLVMAGHRIEPAVRMIECDPGNVGEEVALPPDCREALVRPTAVLVVW